MNDNAKQGRDLVGKQRKKLAALRHGAASGHSPDPLITGPKQQNTDLHQIFSGWISAVARVTHEPQDAFPAMTAASEFGRYCVANGYPMMSGVDLLECMSAWCRENGCGVSNGKIIGVIFNGFNGGI